MASYATIPVLLQKASEGQKIFPESVKGMARMNIRSIQQSLKSQGRDWPDWRRTYRGLLQEIFDRYRALSMLDGDSDESSPKTLYSWRKSRSEYITQLTELEESPKKLSQA